MSEINDFEYCLRCKRRLKKPEYRLRGYGKVCWDKQFKDTTEIKPLFERLKDADSNT